MARSRYPRLRRLPMRLFRWGVLVFVLVVAVRLAWGWEAAARLASARHRFAATGNAAQQREEGIALPDNRNAAVVLVEALRSIKADGLDQFSRGEGRMPFFSRSFGPGVDMSRVRTLVSLNKDAIELIDRAAALPEARWPAMTPVFRAREYNPAFGGGNFQLRWLLRAAAEAAHERGDDAEAIGDVERLLAVARIFDASADVSNHIAAAGMRSEASAAIERWNLQPGGDTAVACRRLLDGLVAQSVDDGRIAAGFDLETASYERSTLDALPQLNGWWLRPLAMDAFARRLSLQALLMPIAHATNWQQVQSVHLPPASERSNLDAIVMTFSEPRIDIADVMRFYFRSLTDTRAGSILLAAGLYRSDEKGFPSTVAALVPKYLPAAPVDPYDGAGKPLRYRLDRAGPTVWSVGENGLDEEGAVGTTMASGFGFARRYGQPDIVYGAGWRAAMAAAATAP